MRFLHNFVFTSEKYGTSFSELVKEQLTYLGVDFIDPCCGVSLGVPLGTAMTGIPEVSDAEVSNEVLQALFTEIQTLKQEIEILKQK